ncbi:hypothetical protein MF271_02395 (plasmid) [Deinococcus sp. KNUC1210]|uniref:hypothetical protein n=1 Tax=Deinococcus sp. KNUC1210 TaxID=2917691 RepID=UPI001EEFEF17|nr:hypothetical protein [Deinococcus sp. KNUC1210]ULH14148.1 hypothetical protein MF271_02395 [Deinococcus sp. KNUC1210]
MSRLKLTYDSGEVRIIDGLTTEQIDTAMSASGVVMLHQLVNGFATPLLLDVSEVEMEEMPDSAE